MSAVAHDASNVGTKVGGANTTHTVALTIAANSNRYLLVFIHVVAATLPVFTSVTWNGSESLTLLDSVITGSGSDTKLLIYGLKNPSSGAHNVVATFTGTNDEMFLSAHSCYNVDQTTPAVDALSSASVAQSLVNMSVAAGVDDLIFGSSFYSRSSGVGGAMASVAGFAEFQSVGTLKSATATTITNNNAPAGRTLDDYEICILSVENNDTISLSGSGWVRGDNGTELGQAGFKGAWAYRKYNGSNVDPVWTWTNSNDASSWRLLYKIAGQPARSGTAAVGNGTTHTSTAAGSPSATSTFIVVDICNANTSPGTPTNYTSDNNAGSATGPVRLGVFHRNGNNGSPSVTGGNARWFQFQIEIPADPSWATQTDRGNPGDYDAGFIAGISASSASNASGAAHIGFKPNSTSSTYSWAVAAVAVKALSGTDATVTVPGASALAITGLAPTIAASAALTSGVGSLALTGFAPVVACNVNVAAGVGALSLTGFAPSLSTGLSLVAGVSALALTGFAPSVACNVNVAAGVSALALTGLAPTVAASAGVGAGKGTLALTGFAPTVVGNANAAAGLGSLVLTGFAPNVSTAGDALVAAGVGALTITGFAPRFDASVAPGLGTLALTGLAPLISTGAALTTGLGSISITGRQPAIQGDAGIASGKGALALTGFAPTLSTSVAITAGVGAITIQGQAPTVTAGADTNVNAGVGSMSLASFAPTVSGGATFSPGAAALALFGFAPTVDAGRQYIPTFDLERAAFAPTQFRGAYSLQSERGQKSPVQRRGEKV